MPRLLAPLVFAVMLITGPAAQAAPPAAPLAHHQHLFSPEIAALLAKPGEQAQTVTADDLAGLLDQAGIGKAVVLSVAYLYGSPSRQVEDEYARVRALNDWTADQAARYPGRLRAFCSFNPLKDYALKELERCAATPGLRGGIKLHFGNSDVQLENSEHATRLGEVFSAANRHGMAIVLHMRASISKKRPYGAVQAQVFLDKLLQQAPDVVVQVAHFASAGPGYEDPPGVAAMSVLAAAVAKGDPRTRHLMFDIASLANGDLAEGERQQLVRFVRQVGPTRVLYGSDAALGSNLRPREAWAALCKLPLNDDELAAIAANKAPYLQ
jgi:predicted TIM-barrel fold metal-dependent hydrolase